MSDLAASVGIGFVSGVLSGAFGIGGGLITTPAIRLLLGAPALVAVGTPLPVIFPTALTGAITYARNGVADVRTGLICGVAGVLTAVVGAIATDRVGGDVVLLITAALVIYAAVDMTVQTLRMPKRRPQPPSDALAGSPAEQPAAPLESPQPQPQTPASTWRLVAIGAATGLYSGFLGLGGGFVLVPLLTRWLGYDIKRAIATSLVAVTVLAVPGTITHALLGHVDWAIAAALTLGVVPGAILGARMTLGAADRTVRLGFAVLLMTVAVWLAVNELPGVLR